MWYKYKLVNATTWFALKREVGQLNTTLSHTFRWVEELRKGNYNHVSPDGNAQIFRSLKELAGSLGKFDDKEKQQAWQSHGLALFMEILKGASNNLSLLSDKIISTLVNYLDANQGGFFVVEQQDSATPVIRLAGCYAYGRKKYLEKDIEPGQGLVGQAYLEKSTAYLTRVPPGYTTITSGLGEATPASILIVPLKINGVVRAIVEIASFNHFESYQIEFIEKLGENIAAAIEAIIINRRTEQLLRDSQQRAEELRAQEEEMRQNMEELAAMHENQSRLQSELSDRVTELEKAKAQIEMFKQAEAEKMKRQNEVQAKIMNAALEKFKKRETELLGQLQEKESELASLKKALVIVQN